MIITQETKKAFGYYLNNKRMQHRAYGIAVLHGTNEKAREILSIFGAERSFLTGTSFVTAENIAEFYGVEQSYVCSVLNYNKLVATNYPNDIIRTSTQDMLRRNGVYNCAVTNYKGKDPEWLNNLTAIKYGEYELKTTAHVYNFYSARMFLAMAAFMYYGQTIPSSKYGFARDCYRTIKEADYLQNFIKMTNEPEEQAAQETTEGQLEFRKQLVCLYNEGMPWLEIMTEYKINPIHFADWLKCEKLNPRKYILPWNGLYKIGEVAKLTGIPHKTLDEWDRTDKLKPHISHDIRHRYYSEEQVGSLLEERAKELQAKTEEKSAAPQFEVAGLSLELLQTLIKSSVDNYMKSIFANQN